MIIRRMKKRDILSVVALEEACFPDPWMEGQITYELMTNPCSISLVCEEDKKIVGYLDFMITFDSGTINRLAVHPDHRQKGIATALINAMVDICQHQKEEVDYITLEVRKSNKAAIALYFKLGWERVVFKKHYYRNGEDAIYMMRSIIVNG